MTRNIVEFNLWLIKEEEKKTIIRGGWLQCANCIHHKNCYITNDKCVANYIYEGRVVHLVDKEKNKEETE